MNPRPTAATPTGGRTGPPPDRWRRDRATWLDYGAVGAVGLTYGAIGPVMPLLRAELGLGYTAVGLHLAVYGAGMAAAGLAAATVLRRLHPRLLLGVGLAGLLVGGLILAAAVTTTASLTAMVVAGGVGSLVLPAAQADLAARHPARRASTLAEANIGAAVGAAVTAAAIALAATAGQWRLGLGAQLIVTAALLLSLRNEPGLAGHPPTVQTATNIRLPRRFWTSWSVLVLAVTVEWAVSFWAPSYLRDVTGLSVSAAGRVAVTLYSAMIVGRIAVSRLSLRHPPHRLLLGCLALVGTGLAVLPTANTAVPSTVGLAVAGLGVAGLFPLSLALVLHAGRRNIAAASARATLGTGLAMTVSPLLLAEVAEQASLATALPAASPVLLLAAAISALNHRMGVARG